VVGLLITYGVHQTLYEQGQSLFAVRQLGWGESDIGNLNAINNILLGLASLVGGGLLIDRFGPRIVALISGFAALVVIGGFALLPGLWHSEPIYIAWVLCGLPTTLFYLSFLVMAMRVSAAEVAATSFALIVATQSVGISIGGWLLGAMDEWGGFTAIFGTSALLIALAGLLPLWTSRHASGPATGKGEGLLDAVTKD
jgi:predicted MFS family arabinose efflux permease